MEMKFSALIFVTLIYQLPVHLVNSGSIARIVKDADLNEEQAEQDNFGTQLANSQTPGLTYPSLYGLGNIGVGLDGVNTDNAGGLGNFEVTKKPRKHRKGSRPQGRRKDTGILTPKLNEAVLDNRDPICKLPLERGDCRARIYFWGYDVAQGTCVDFVYGGCGGNDNRFDTKEECLRRCSGAPSTIRRSPSKHAFIDDDNEETYIPAPDPKVLRNKARNRMPMKGNSQRQDRSVSTTVPTTTDVSTAVINEPIRWDHIVNSTEGIDPSINLTCIMWAYNATRIPTTTTIQPLTTATSTVIPVTTTSPAVYTIPDRYTATIPSDSHIKPTTSITTGSTTAVSTTEPPEVTSSSTPLTTEVTSMILSTTVTTEETTSETTTELENPTTSLTTETETTATTTGYTESESPSSLFTGFTEYETPTTSLSTGFTETETPTESSTGFTETETPTESSTGSTETETPTTLLFESSMESETPTSSFSTGPTDSESPTTLTSEETKTYHTESDIATTTALMETTTEMESTTTDFTTTETESTSTSDTTWSVSESTSSSAPTTTEIESTSTSAETTSMESTTAESTSEETEYTSEYEEETETSTMEEETTTETEAATTETSTPTTAITEEVTTMIEMTESSTPTAAPTEPSATTTESLETTTSYEAYVISTVETITPPPPENDTVIPNITNCLNSSIELLSQVGSSPEQIEIILEALMKNLTAIRNQKQVLKSNSEERESNIEEESSVTSTTAATTTTTTASTTTTTTTPTTTSTSTTVNTPTRACGEGQRYYFCRPCDAICNKRERKCPHICKPGCACKKGFARKFKRGPCIAVSECSSANTVTTGLQFLPVTAATVLIQTTTQILPATTSKEPAPVTENSIAARALPFFPEDYENDNEEGNIAPPTKIRKKPAPTIPTGELDDPSATRHLVFAEIEHLFRAFNATGSSPLEKLKLVQKYIPPDRLLQLQEFPEFITLLKTQPVAPSAVGAPSNKELRELLKQLEKDIYGTASKKLHEEDDILDADEKIANEEEDLYEEEDDNNNYRNLDYNSE